ncbi:hypothetical protein PVK06_007533 [Gossypium arboreum]|uniref:Uncharacterized protein n=1 Tax=Gossypium arboreum TaxID=29729 RepID=A0ABR0QHK4_GOSAR|nr:hypothetical protein PVK06_007533 [Gossypium arboreum]
MKDLGYKHIDMLFFTTIQLNHYSRKMRRRRLRDLSIVQNTLNSEEANSEHRTVIRSSNVSETLDKPAEFQTESGGTRRGRGRTLLKDLYDSNPVERVKVSRNSHGQPVGSEARLLAGYLGIIARNVNMLPINYESWHHMPDSNKNQALDNIKDRERVGTSSRQKQKFTHTVGSKSFASVAEAEEVSSGQKVGRLQLFEITHRNKDGSPMTSEARQIMEKLKEKNAEYEAIASIDSSVNLENIDNRIITEVLDPESSEVKRPDSSDASEHTAREAAAAAREAEVVAMAAEQSRKYDELQLQLQHMMKMFQQSQKLSS